MTDTINMQVADLNVIVEPGPDDWQLTQHMNILASSSLSHHQVFGEITRATVAIIAGCLGW